MHITIVAVGHKMPNWVKEAWDDYAKRLPHDYQVTLKEVRPESRTLGKTPEQMMQAEASRILTAIPKDSLIVALDEHGKDLTTVQLSQSLKQWHDANQDVALLIGGPDGLDAQLKQQSRQKLRLSSLTLPHPMVRVLLIEQIYRAWSILNNHPYHRA